MRAASAASRGASCAFCSTMYRAAEIFQADKQGWPGDWEGRTILALCLHERISGRKAAFLAKFMEAYAMEENEKERKKILGKIVVIGAYIKRRSNLILIAEQSAMFPIRELELCFRETIRSLEWNHVEAAFVTSLDEIRSEDAMQIYDFLEAVIEESLEDLSAFTLNHKRRDEKILVSLSVECKTDLQKVARSTTNISNMIICHFFWCLPRI